MGPQGSEQRSEPRRARPNGQAFSVVIWRPGGHTGRARRTLPAGASHRRREEVARKGTDCDDPSVDLARRRGGPARVVRRRGDRVGRGAGPRPERAGVRPQHADQPDPGGGRRGGDPAGLQPVRDAALLRCCSSPAPMDPATDPLNFQVGYYTAVAGLGQSPNDVVINGSVYVRNQCDGGQLHRAQQLLAVALEPDDQRDHPGLRLLQRRVLGRVAGGADAPGPRQRAHHPDGLLHRPVVRERRLHRRLGVRRQHRDQRLTAAVAGQEQLARRLDQRRLEPGVLGCRRRAGPVLPRCT